MAPQRNSLIEEMYISAQNVEDTLNDTQNNELKHIWLRPGAGGSGKTKANFCVISLDIIEQIYISYKIQYRFKV